VSAYVHPVIGGIAVILLVYAAALGFQLRTARRGRAALATRHARLAPLAYWAVVASWMIGAATTRWWREDMPFASTLHFRIGAAIVVLLTGSALTARALRTGNRTARELHPWLGAAAVLLAAAHVMTGLQLLP
jgi:hypothetical protein